MRQIDLRSDTVTRPTDGMRQVMATAIVGDDVFGEDPTIIELEARMASTLSMEAGLFVASGTMSNLVALLTHAGRGDEIIMGKLAHTFLYEAGGAAALGGLHPHILENDADGTLRLEDIAAALRNADDIHQPPTRLVTLENSHNRCGGVALTTAYCDAVADLARQHGLIVHLDGARLFNAAIALGVDVKTLTRCADSVSVCLSKGLGAPVGSVLCGSATFIKRARHIRKQVGGGMRQAGILAAAGLYALEHHIDRLADDHVLAHRLAKGIDAIPGLRCEQATDTTRTWTNLVYFTLDNAVASKGLDAPALSARLAERNVLCLPLGHDGRRIRMVTHLDVDAADIQAALDTLQSVMNET